MKLVIQKQNQTISMMYVDTDTVSIDETGLTINGAKYSQYTSLFFLLIEDVTAEAFLLNVNNQIWKYNI